MTIHVMRVDSVDYKNRGTVFQCDECPRRLEIRGKDITIVAEGDLLAEHAGGIGVSIRLAKIKE